MTKYPLGARNSSLTLVLENWPIAKERPKEKDRCSKDTPVWEKLDVITEKKVPKPQTSVGKLKTSHNGN